jgi:peptidoglycan/LPS O-acetylase OafA/YrhL
MKRNQSLDVLRGVAILLVVGYHANYYPIWARIGWAGVPLFFVLSGFLISGLLFKEYKESGSINVPKFFCRRAFKIWPSYYALLILTVYFYHLARLAIPVRSAALATTFLSNYFQGTEYEFIPVGHIWSVCVEEHFYFLLPIIFIVLMRLRRSEGDPFWIIPSLSGFSVLFCLFLRIVIHPKDGWTARTDLLFDSLLAGVLLGYLFHFRPAWFAKVSAPRWIFLSALLFSPMMFLERATRGVETIGLTAVTIAFFFVVAWSVGRERLVPGFVGALFARIGFYSYSIYLWHMYLTPRVIHYPVTFFAFWLYLVASICLGVLMANLIELPFLAIRERIVPRVKSGGISTVKPDQAAALA